MSSDVTVDAVFFAQTHVLQPGAPFFKNKELVVLIRAATRWIDASRPAEQETGIMQRLKGMLPAISGKGGANRV